MALALKEIHPASHATERQLVRSVRDGDDRAFEQLFSRYRRRISAYVYGLLNDHGRAEDITQEVFISALRRLRETEGAIAFKPWIYEIARNACIDEFRRISRANLVSLDADVAEEGPIAPQLADYVTPEVRFQRKQQMGDLFGAFSGLPDNQHKILVLRELEGLSYGEIGQRMGMSRPMVESTLFRARRRVTQEYDELASGRRCLDVQAAVDRGEPRGLHTLGIRERRRIARHLNHCQDCLRYARMAGVERQAFEVPGIARRVAALLPFGWIRNAWGSGKARLHGSAVRGAHHASLGEGTPQTVAAGRAAAAAAALLITGGALAPVVTHHGSSRAARPASALSAPNWYPTSAVDAIVQVPTLVTPRRASAVPAGKPHGAAGPQRRQATGARATRRTTGGSTSPKTPGRHGARGTGTHPAGGGSAPPASGSGSPSGHARPPQGLQIPNVPGIPPLPPAIQQPLGNVPSPVTKVVGNTINTVAGGASRTVSGVTGGLSGTSPGSSSSGGSGGPTVSVPGLP